MANNVYTVRQVNTYIKNMFTQDFMLNRIYVKGEVSNCKYHTSGHIYFSLKDESGTIACVMFAGQRGGLSFRMKEGQQVIVFGAVSVYERSGAYQLYAREIRLDGEGALYERFQMLKRELEEMGMFAAEYKQPIPKFARTVGVVTASTGAAIRDIIRMLEAKQVDVIIVGRGGGSMEDLWAFNEEEVARAIFECRIPVISAVGHETDTTIADYAADLRAPTPSAAAELAVWDYAQYAEQLRGNREKLARLMKQRLEWYRMRGKELRVRISYLHPEVKLRDRRNQAVEIEEKLQRLMEQRLYSEKHRLAVLIARLKGLSPLEKLSQGYAFLEQEAEGRKRAVRSVKQVKKGDSLSVYVADGRIQAEVAGTREEEYE